MATIGIGAGWLINLANTLGIPLGARYKKYENKKSSNKYAGEEEIPPQIAVISEITRDDICLTDAPFFYNSPRLRLGKQLQSKLDLFTDALNSIARSVAFDILTVGCSVYKLRYLSGEIFFEPLIGDLSFYLIDNKVIVVHDDKVLNDLIVFVNYEKRDLVVTEFEGVPVLEIKPVGLQTRYTKDLLDKLKTAEDALVRLRNQMRYIRYATVEVGLNKGDSQQELVDDISEGLNANSQDLPQANVFQDNIPVFPTRRGVGAPKVEEHSPDHEIGKLTDIEYYQTQLALYTRFPKSYSDFSANLSATALSMIRGDIRYERLLSAARSLMERTVNEYLKGISVIEKASITYHLKSIPSSEDTDLLDTLEQVVSLLTSILNLIGDSEGADEFIVKQKVVILTKMFDAVRETSIISDIKNELNTLVSLMFTKEGDGGDTLVDGDFPIHEEGGGTDYNPDSEPPTEEVEEVEEVEEE